jgi:RNA polymerase sigma factor (sigma-70 family)
VRSDEQLVALFRDGQEEAFRVIHDRYKQRLFAYTRQMLLGSRQDAEEALQDVFVRAYAGLRASDQELSLRAWLYRVAHNRCVDELRRPSPPAPEVLGLLRAPVHDPTIEAEQRESLRRLIEDVRRLPQQQRSALLMRELGGMAYSDVSGALGVSVPAVKSLLVRARIGLAQALEARDTACDEIREELIVSHDRGVRPSGRARRHMHDCAGCREFRTQIRGVSRQFAALVPTLGPIGVLANVLGIGGGAGGGAAAAGSGAGVAAAGGAAGTGGALASAGVLAGGVTHVATLLAAAVVTVGGAVELQHTVTAPAHHARHHVRAAQIDSTPSAAATAPVHATPAPVDVDSQSYQPATPAKAATSPAHEPGTTVLKASGTAQTSSPATSAVSVSGGDAPGDGLNPTGGASGATSTTDPGVTTPATGTATSTGVDGTGTSSTTGTADGSGSTAGSGGSSSTSGTATGSGTTSGTGSSGTTTTTSQGSGSTTPSSSSTGTTSVSGSSSGQGATTTSVTHILHL